jgi:hypothetical protein
MIQDTAAAASETAAGRAITDIINLQTFPILVSWGYGIFKPAETDLAVMTACEACNRGANTAKSRDTAKNSGGTAIILAVFQIAERSTAEECRGGGDVDR